MAYATIDDVVARAGGNFFTDADISCATALLDDAAYALEGHFAKAGKSHMLNDISVTLAANLKAVSVQMVLRYMDSLKRADTGGYDAYTQDPFAADSHYNYRGSLKPTNEELSILGIVGCQRVGSISLG